MIVIPMAGLSSRFTRAGYNKPKYMLEAHGQSLFYHCINSFKKYFNQEEFLFIARDINDTKQFIESECKSLGIKSYSIAILSESTKGQAETVFLGLNQLKMKPKSGITIFNIDTIRPNFTHPDFLNEDTDGYLEVFNGPGDNWSFIEPKKNQGVSRTTEKDRISDYCSNGLYYFKSWEVFVSAYSKMLKEGEEKWQAGELYIAPLYNYLIQQGQNIKYQLIKRSEVIFSGTPAEYIDFLEQAYKPD